MPRLSVLAVLVVLVVTIGSSLAQQSPPEAPDLRLEKKITLKMEKQRLPDVLAEVRKQTGVDIRVDKQKRFWAVRQRKVTLFVKDMPLKDFTAQLKLLLGYHITRLGKPGDYGYTVWQDINGRKTEQDIINAQYDRNQERKRRAVYETVSDCARALTMTPEEIERAKQTEPWVAELASDPNRRQYASLVCAIPPEQFDRLLRDDSLYIEPDMLTADAKAVVDKIVSADKSWPKGTFDNLDKFNISVSVAATGHGSYSLCIGAYPKEPGQFGRAVGGFEIASSDSEPKLRMLALAKLTSGGMTKDAAGQKISQAIVDGEHRDQTPEAVLTELLGKRQAKRPANDEADSELQKLIDLSLKKEPGQNEYLSKTFEKLASESGLNVMYEYFNKEELPRLWAGQKQEIRVALKSICHDNGLQWTKDGNTLRLRCKDWPWRRSWEIQDELVNKWRASIEKNNGLPFDDIADMSAKLTDEQIDHNFDANRAELSMLDNPKLAKLFALAGAIYAKHMRSMLAFYGSLDSDQKKKLWSKGGLPVEDVPAENWPKLNGAVTLWDNDIPVYDAVFLASMGTETDPKAPNVDFTMRAKVWLKDLPTEMRQRHTEVMARESPEKLAHADTEPVETEFGNGFGLTRNSEAVRKLLDEIKQDEKKTD